MNNSSNNTQSNDTSEIVLPPKSTKNKFTKEEDKLLIDLAIEYGEKKWKKISTFFPNKNYLQCFSRFKRIKPGIKRGTWTKEEDILLLKFHKSYGCKWSLIAKELKTRNGKQIRERFVNVLDPTINRGPFTLAEDENVLQSFKLYGCQWAKIAKNFNTKRTADMIKNRFYSHLKYQGENALLKKKKKKKDSSITADSFCFEIKQNDGMIKEEDKWILLEDEKNENINDDKKDFFIGMQEDKITSRDLSDSFIMFDGNNE